jgi:hypothetical protein
MVEDVPASPLGVAAGRRAVRSRRTANEKRPWKLLPALHGAIEAEFIRPVHLGATLLPFRLLQPWLGVIPWDGERLLDSTDPRLELYPGLADWWTRAEEIWDGNKGESHLTLLERSDYRKGLSQQFPTAKHRVYYSASGQYLAAARAEDERAVVEHKLYWAAAESLDEARYLTALLNSPALTGPLASRQSRGEHNPRDFDKLVWELPIPRFEPNDPIHRQLAELAAQAEALAAATDVTPQRTFQAQRRAIREELTRLGLAAEIDDVVASVVEAAV